LTVPRDRSDVQFISFDYVFIGGEHTNEALSRCWRFGCAGPTSERIGSIRAEGGWSRFGGHLSLDGRDAGGLVVSHTEQRGQQNSRRPVRCTHPLRTV